MTASRKLAAPITLAMAICVVAWAGVRAWGENPATAVDAASAARRASAAEQPVDVEQRLMSRIEPGAQLDAGPPKDWSHLVLHAVPRVAEGDVKKASALVNRLVSQFHLTVLANVQAVDNLQPPLYRLEKVAIGMALPIGGKETVISSATQQALGAKLGFVDRNALAETETSLHGVRQVARTGTMLVFDAPSIMRLDKKNRSVTQRHAILVSPNTGKLATLVWILEPGEEGALRLVDDDARLLPESCEDDRKIYIDAAQFSFGIPNKQAFALVSLPEGDSIPIAESWRNLAVSKFQESADAVSLEQALRAALGWNKEVTQR